MDRQDVQTYFMFPKDMVICEHDRYALCVEVDLFNDHLMYFVREDGLYDYGYNSDYELVITEFLARINEEENR